MIHRYIVFSLVLVVAIFVAASLNPQGVSAGSTGDSKAPTLKFSHKFHISEAGLECAACHPAVAASKVSSENLHPGHEQCQSCHEEQIGNTCNYCHVDPDNIEPRVVPAREFRFSHAQHLSGKDTVCQTCHVGIETSEQAGGHPLPSMATCNTCHNDRKVTNQCEACHTDFAHFLPRDHQRSDFRKFHGEEIRLGALDVSCQTCHKETFCQQCHQTTGLKSFGKKDMMTDPRPKTSTKDSPEQMMLQRVHELNYRLTHGIDARSRRSDCATCHDQREFCGECHEAGGNITQQHFKPASHMVPGFTTLGAGSGGGLHAEEARRDMESCMTCHDLQGQDPTCLTCHATNGKVR